MIAIHLFTGGGGNLEGGFLPAPVWTVPAFSLQAVAGIAVPLFIVTMASQNIPGVAVLKSFGYTTPWAPSMLVTGAGTMLSAPFGGHAINLAALSAALAAGNEAGGDRSRRWIAAFTSGLAYLGLALFSAALVTVVSAPPPGLLEAVAGLALIGTLAASVSSALAVAEERIDRRVRHVPGCRLRAQFCGRRRCFLGAGGRPAGPLGSERTGDARPRVSPPSWAALGDETLETGRLVGVSVSKCPI